MYVPANVTNARGMNNAKKFILSVCNQVTFSGKKTLYFLSEAVYRELTNSLDTTTFAELRSQYCEAK